MKEPLRLRDDASVSEDVRSLLRGDSLPRRMTPSQRARTSKRIAVLAAAPVATASLLGLKGVALAAVALGTGALAATTLAGPWRSDAPLETEPARALIASAMLQAPQVTPPSAAPPPPIAPEAQPPAAEPSAAAVPQVGSAKPAIAPAGSDRPPQDTLRAEAAVLERARSLVTSDPSASLAVLHEHARAFPRGKLSAERELIAVDALRRAGRNAEARARGEALLARTRGGLYEERVRALLEALP